MDRVELTSFIFLVALATSSGIYHELVGWTARNPALIPTQDSFICYLGPPGLYCSFDLSGYTRCNADNSQTDYTCPPQTRCSCFVGARCDASVVDPCQPFAVPPSLPFDVTTVSYGTVKILSLSGTIIYTFSKQQYQNYNNGVFSRRGDRQDTTWLQNGAVRRTVIQNTFNAVGNGNEFIRYLAQLHPLPSTCTTTSGLTKMPLLQIPHEAQADGKETILGEEAFRWMFKAGGQSSGGPRSTEYFYYVDDKQQGFLRPKRYFARFDRGQGGKATVIVNETFGLFYDKLVPSVGFYSFKPYVCRPTAGK